MRRDGKSRRLPRLGIDSSLDRRRRINHGTRIRIRFDRQRPGPRGRVAIAGIVGLHRHLVEAGRLRRSGKNPVLREFESAGVRQCIDDDILHVGVAGGRIEDDNLRIIRSAGNADHAATRIAGAVFERDRSVRTQRRGEFDRGRRVVVAFPDDGIFFIGGNDAHFRRHEIRQENGYGGIRADRRPVS